MSWKRWWIIQKVTISRGYVWLQSPVLSVLLATQLKLLFPAFFDGLFRFVLLIIASFLLLYFIGWVDRRWKFLDEENSYFTDTNTSLLNEIRSIRK